ncbi:hypothetical protein [Novipirellula caenicola]|uniref:Lipoprotein n=1 Tax=Novipirellula caenicola TaxID=1536901 RepID=A0ABP9VYB1_9BACT
MPHSIVWLGAVLVFAIGCDTSRDAPVPKMKPVQRVVGTLLDVPELGIRPGTSIEVPDSEVSKILSLAWPEEHCDSELGDRSTPIARLEIFHEDGSQTDISIRWTGSNPAAVTMDNRAYFFGGFDGFPDGATRIARLLRDYAQETGEVENVSETDMVE